MAIEKTINAEGFFGKIQQALRDGLGNGLAGGANLGTVTLEVKDARLQRAEEGISRSEALNRDFSQRPGGGLSGNWDRPEDYPERDLGPMGARRWAAIQQEGGIYALRNAGAFYQRWGGVLGDRDRSEASMWGAIAGSPQGRRVEESFSGIERAGKKMSDLMSEYEQAGRGTPAAMRATEQMVKLHEAIQALAKSGSEAADAIGGDHGGKLKKELEEVTQLASSGKMGGPGASGGGLTGDLVGFMRLAHGDPLGAARSIFGAKFLRRLNAALTADTLGGSFDALGGGMAGAAAIGAASLAALYGGFKFGWGLQASSAHDAMGDAGKALDDYRLSNMLGAGTDIRGALYTGGPDGRLHLNENSFAYRGNLNMLQARRMLTAMGLGAGGWHGGFESQFTTGETIYKKALDFGVDDTALAGVVGASVRGGMTRRGGGSVEQLLSWIGGLIAEGNKNGVASNETLGVIASLGQMEQARMGFVSQSSMRYLSNVTRVFNASGVDALKGQGGLSTIQKLGANQNQVFNTTLALEFLTPDGQLTPAAWKQVVAAMGGDEGRAKELVERLGPQFVAQLLANDPGNKVKWSQSMARAFGPGAGYQMNHLLFGDNGNIKDFAGLFSLRGKNLGAMGFPYSDGDKRTAAAQQEASQYENVAALSLMTEEVRKSTMALGDMVAFLNAKFPMAMLQSGAASSAWDITKHPLSNAFAPSQSRGGRPPAMDPADVARGMGGDPF
jgi:hypothetical protein